MRKGEIACYKQFLLISPCFPYTCISLVRQNVALCGNGLNSYLKTLWKKDNMLVVTILAF